MGKAQIDLQKRVYLLGEEVIGSVHVSLDKSVSHRSASTYLTGKERTQVTYSEGDTSFTAVEESEFLHQEFPLALPVDGKGKFKSGNCDLPFRFKLPQGLPLTYKGKHAKILYAITTKIDIPHGTDIRASSEFDVVSSPNTGSRPQTVSGQINSCSVSWNDPASTGISFTLEKCEYRRGQDLNGRCAFKNPSSKSLRKIDVTLKWIETATAKRHTTKTQVANQTTRIKLGGRVHRGETPFNIPIPQDAPLTYHGSLSALECILRAKLDVALRSDVAAEQNLEIVENVADRKGFPFYPSDMQSDASKSISEREYEPKYADRRGNLAGMGQRSGPYCPYCGGVLKTPDSRFCTHCGARMPAER